MMPLENLLLALHFRKEDQFHFYEILDASMIKEVANICKINGIFVKYKIMHIFTDQINTCIYKYIYQHIQ